MTDSGVPGRQLTDILLLLLLLLRLVT